MLAPFVMIGCARPMARCKIPREIKVVTQKEHATATQHTPSIAASISTCLVAFLVAGTVAAKFDRLGRRAPIRQATVPMAAYVAPC